MNDILKVSIIRTVYVSSIYIVMSSRGFLLFGIYQIFNNLICSTNTQNCCHENVLYHLSIICVSVFTPHSECLYFGSVCILLLTVQYSSFHVVHKSRFQTALLQCSFKFMKFFQGA